MYMIFLAHRELGLNHHALSIHRHLIRTYLKTLWQPHMTCAD